MQLIQLALSSNIQTIPRIASNQTIVALYIQTLTHLPETMRKATNVLENKQDARKIQGAFEQNFAIRL